jgi:gliding motility-associated-like protein
MIKRIIFTLQILGLAIISYGQCGSGPILTVNNPSFEGTPEAHVTPPGWDICLPGVTPDTQPGFWGCTLPPSNGSSYIGLVNQPSTGWQEGAGQTLSSPMVAGTTYNFTIDLATMASADPATGIILPPYCDQLQLWGGMAGVNSGCDQSELLWTSPVITNTTWQTYSLTFTPTQNWNHILLLIYTPPPACTDGQYLLMDNMSTITPIADVADFTWTGGSTGACFGTTIQFTDASVSASGTINGWSWDFGDGGTSNLQNPTHDFTTTGNHTVTLTTYSTVPCTTVVTHTVTIWDIPTVTVSGGGSLCNGGSLTVPVTFTFTGNPPWNLTYTDGTTPTTVNGINTSPYTINVGGTGTYTATSLTDAHCTGTTSGSAIVAVSPPPVVTFTQPPDVCVTVPPFSMTGGSPIGGNYHGTGITSNIFDPTVTGTGTFPVTYVYIDPVTGCSDSAVQNITVNLGVTVTVSPSDAFICPGTSINLTASGASTYHWSPPLGLNDTLGATVIAQPPTTTTYTVFGVSAGGCTGSATGTVNFYNTNAVAITATPDEGCQPLETTFTYSPLNLVLDSTWNWNFGDYNPFTNHSNLMNPSYNYQYPGAFQVIFQASDINGCLISDTTIVNVYRLPVADFHYYPFNAIANLNPVNFVDLSTLANEWEWDFGDPASISANTSMLQNPTHMFSDSGTFNIQLIVTSIHHCTDTVVKQVAIYPELLVYIPNAFTPNNDGTNDIFKPIMSGIDKSTYKLYIFDRWGQMVFSTTDVNEGWDGTYKGKPLTNDTYTYLMYYYDTLGKDYKRLGSVTIIR